MLIETAETVEDQPRHAYTAELSALSHVMVVVKLPGKYALAVDQFGKHKQNRFIQHYCHIDKANK